MCHFAITPTSMLDKRWYNWALNKKIWTIGKWIQLYGDFSFKKFREQTHTFELVDSNICITEESNTLSSLSKSNFPRIYKEIAKNGESPDQIRDVTIDRVFGIQIAAARLNRHRNPYSNSCSLAVKRCWGGAEQDEGLTARFRVRSVLFHSLRTCERFEARFRIKERKNRGNWCGRDVSRV